MVFDRLIAIVRKQPLNNQSNLSRLSFYERFEKETKEAGIKPFLFGKYYQELYEDFDAPLDKIHQPFIIALPSIKLESVLKDIANGKTVEFDASVCESSIIGYAKGSAKGTIDSKSIHFIKEYEKNRFNDEPIEYIGRFDGKNYRGEWKFNNQKGTFYASFDRNISDGKIEHL